MIGKSAILFESHIISKSIIREFEKILSESEGFGDTYFCYDNKGEELPHDIKKFKHYGYNFEEISALNYPILEKIESNREIRNKVAYRHVNYQLSILKFFLENPGYDFYWYIEYDVKYTGNWGNFFNSFDDQSDFISSYVRTFSEQPDWPFWYLYHPTLNIQQTERIRSFNPVMRLSNKALKDLHNSLLDGWVGYLEMLMPTLLKEHGYKLEDLGGSGKFCKKENINKNYTGSKVNSEGSLDFGTMRYRPHILYLGLKNDKLYHPVKPLRKRFSYYFIRAKRNLRKKL